MAKRKNQTKRSGSRKPAGGKAAKASDAGRKRLVSMMLVAGAAVVVLAFLLFARGGGGGGAVVPSSVGAVPPAGAVAIPDVGGVQRISIAAQNSFSPGELIAKAGLPIELDFGPGTGCAQAVKLPSLGVEKAIAGTGGVVKLASVKPGRYDIYCQSNMDMGTLYVR
jgi:hypothetical protein